MTFNSRIFFISIFFGVLAALFSISPLFAFLCPLPILYISLKFGNFASLFATTVTAAILSFLYPGGETNFFHYLLVYIIPAFLTGYMLNISRNSNDIKNNKFFNLLFTSSSDKSNIKITNKTLKATNQAQNKVFLSIPHLVLSVIIILLFSYSLSIKFQFYSPAMEAQITKLSEFIYMELKDKLLLSKQIVLVKEDLLNLYTKVIINLLTIFIGISLFFNMIINLYLTRNVVPNPISGRVWTPLTKSFRLSLFTKIILLVTLISIFTISNLNIQLFLNVFLGLLIAATIAAGFAVIHNFSSHKTWGNKLLLTTYICSIGFLVMGQLVAFTNVFIAVMLQIISFISFMLIFLIGIFAKTAK
ncbi:hypothetical protein [Bartonella sp. DGB1]|uniref:hypothetical protein n=1 Tax=Bartonella sp. DGB1 TaxID=3239807 RepID=UPI0035232B55